MTKASYQLFATYEFLGNGRAMVSFHDGLGGWQGAGTVERSGASRDDLYELCYTRASQQASCKGMQLERFSEGVA